VAWCWVGRVQRGRSEDRLGNRSDRMGVKDLILRLSITVQEISTKMATHPAGVGVQEPPPDAISANSLHTATPVQEHSQHALAQVNDLLVLLRIGRIGSIVCHSMFLRDRWDD